ncbi:glycoside hydrolase family 97 catalytic domain-containing protein [Cyclobacterium plantarum]|uniref:glycoside hydrolase family 97 protein n=1 Tax=Cyclobacterium plantarum TaxID=2716263 RepID=UPI003F711B06
MKKILYFIWSTLIFHFACYQECYAILDMEDYLVSSPNGKLTFELSIINDILNFQVNENEREILAPSPIQMRIDGTSITHQVSIEQIIRYESDEKYPARGVHSLAKNHFNGAKFKIINKKSHADYFLDARVFDDGVGFRLIIPGNGLRVPEEETAYHFPEGSRAWYHDLYWHYEGIYENKLIQNISKGEWAAPPLTIKLPDKMGYVFLSEAGLKEYAGLSFQADGNGAFVSRLGHQAPNGYPFAHDYTIEDAQRLAIPAQIDGTITTPWRTLVFGRDLNTLVNSDLIQNLVPKPDEKIFTPKADWVKPGRSVWTWLDGGDRTLDGMKEFSKLAGELGFEYNTVDAFWSRWTDDDIRELVSYSAEHGVKIWLWRHGRDIKDPLERRDFFRRCKDLGIVGVKLDAFSNESKEFIDLYQDCLKDAAEFELMVNFHGNNKPTGESRTWPNEMTREGIRGLEYGRSQHSWATHNTTLPFTRLLAGHGDYTPVVFGEGRLDTSWAHQIGTAVIFTSPLLVYGAHPQSILNNPAVDIIKSIPSTWDETIVLPASEIGELAAFARRKGDSWFLAILNGSKEKSFQLPLDFLGEGIYQAQIGKDTKNPAAIKMEKAFAKRTDTFPVQMLSGGGFVVHFKKN